MNTIYWILLLMAIIYGGGFILVVEWQRKYLQKYNTKVSRLSKEVDEYLTFYTDSKKTE